MARAIGPFDRHPADKFKMAYSPYIVRSALTGRNAIERMADDLVTVSAAHGVNGSVTEDDLILLGWTDPQIASYRRDAMRRAQRMQATPWASR